MSAAAKSIRDDELAPGQLCEVLARSPRGNRAGMNHHPPSHVGRALTVVLGVLPFTVVTLLVFKDWPPLRRWDLSVANEVAEYGAAHPSTVDFWQVVAAIIGAVDRPRDHGGGRRLPVAPPGPPADGLAAGHGRRRARPGPGRETHLRPAPTDPDARRGRRLVVRLRPRHSGLRTGRGARGGAAVSTGLAAPVPAAGHAADHCRGLDRVGRPGCPETCTTSRTCSAAGPSAWPS